VGELRYSSTPFLTSTLDVGEWSGSGPGRFTPGEIATGTHWIGGKYEKEHEVQGVSVCGERTCRIRACSGHVEMAVMCFRCLDPRMFSLSSVAVAVPAVCL
jgi:hypothetical protein